MTPREEAIADMKYAKSLGMTALKQHYLIWRGATLVVGTSNAEYSLAVMEIYDKLDTEKCLLKGEK
jgi:hypothetical protein